jgi:hypothetical protein
MGKGSRTATRPGAFGAWRRPRLARVELWVLCGSGPDDEGAAARCAALRRSIAIRRGGLPGNRGCELVGRRRGAGRSLRSHPGGAAAPFGARPRMARGPCARFARARLRGSAPSAPGGDDGVANGNSRRTESTTSRTLDLASLPRDACFERQDCEYIGSDICWRRSRSSGCTAR